MINYFNIFFSFFWIILVQILGYKNSSPEWFTMISIVLLILGVFGQVFRRTNCIVARDEDVVLYRFGKKEEIRFSEMAGFTNSYSFSGYKALDRSGNALFRWALYWSRGSQFGDYLEEKGVQFSLRRR